MSCAPGQRCVERAGGAVSAAAALRAEEEAKPVQQTPQMAEPTDGEAKPVQQTPQMAEPADGEAPEDEEGLAWYAAAAAGESEEEGEGEEAGGAGEELEEDEAEVEGPEGQQQEELLDDPYLAMDADMAEEEGAEAADDPYAAEAAVEEEQAAAASVPPQDQEETPATGGRQAAAAVLAAAFAADGEELAAMEQSETMQSAVRECRDLALEKRPAAENIDETEPTADPAGFAPARPRKAQRTQEPLLVESNDAALAAVPDYDSTPQDGQEGQDEDSIALELPEPEGGEGEDVWDSRVVVVRHGQIHIEIQHRNPPMRDPTLLRFCDWLDEQLPSVIADFPYVRKSGACVDLSDNVIGPEGLDKLFRVLRDHRVPCVVMKAYRNVLDDSIVDTLIEYLYTQPESFPMHGIHISHNNISDKGALRLVRAAARCGHYPRPSSRLPLWLRLEANDISNPQKFVAECQKEGFHVCLMGDGLCSRPNCNHYSGVHVQLPYFYHQGMKGRDQYDKERSVAQVPPMPSLPDDGPVLVEEDEETKPEEESKAEAEKQEIKVPETEVGGEEVDWGVETTQQVEVEATPDWMRKDRLDVGGCLMVPAPKSVQFQPRAPPPPPAVLASKAHPPDPAVGGLQQVSVRPSLLGLEASPPMGYGVVGACPKSGGGLPLPPLPCQSKACPSAQPSMEQPMGRKGGGQGRGGGRGRSGSDPGGGKGGGSGKGRGRMWQGPTLRSKVKMDVKIPEGELALGFQWRFCGEGHAPRVLVVDPGSKVSEVARSGSCLLRVNGLDTSMFNEKQIVDMLKQRPLSLRFGDE